MTLESTINENRYVGNGATKDFAYTFKVWKQDQVAVWVGDGLSEQEVSASCDISITDTGGTVSFKTAPSSGTIIVLKRNMPYIQEDDYTNGTRFDAEEIEDRLDQDCAERQDLRLEIGRALKFPHTSDIEADGLVQLLLQAIRALQAAGDVSGQSLVRATGSTEYRPLADRFADMVNLLDYGAKGDGVTDDTAAFNAAASAAGDRLIYVPAGSYNLTSTPEGMYFSDGYVDTGNVEIALTDFGDIRASEYLDELNFGFLGAVRRKPDFPSSEDVYVVEGLATDGNDTLYIASNHNNTAQKITKYKISTRTILSTTAYINLSHVNSMDYKDGKLYVATMDSAYRIAKINPSTMAVEEFYTPGPPVTSIVWDASRSCWWGLSGATLYKLNASFASIGQQSIPFGDGETAGQGLACYEGLLFFPRFRADTGGRGLRGHVGYVYDPLVKRVIHKWDMPWGIGEVEDFCFYKGYILASSVANSTYYYYIYGAKFKKGLRTDFGPLVGELIGSPRKRMQQGTPQRATIYVDASQSSQGIGSSGWPFNSIDFAFETQLLIDHPIAEIVFKGDCTESHYISQFRMQGFNNLILRGWDAQKQNNIIGGFETQFMSRGTFSNFTVKPSGWQALHEAGCFLYFAHSNIFLDGIAFNTSDISADNAPEGLVYASYGSYITVSSIDFTNVGIDKFQQFLVRVTNGSCLNLTGARDSYIVPAALDGSRVFDCKTIVSSYYSTLDDIVYKDGTLYAQSIKTGDGYDIDG